MDMEDMMSDIDNKILKIKAEMFDIIAQIGTLQEVQRMKVNELNKLALEKKNDKPKG